MKNVIKARAKKLLCMCLALVMVIGSLCGAMAVTDASDENYNISDYFTKYGTDNQLHEFITDNIGKIMDLDYTLTNDDPVKQSIDITVYPIGTTAGNYEDISVFGSGVIPAYNDPDDNENVSIVIRNISLANDEGSVHLRDNAIGYRILNMSYSSGADVLVAVVEQYDITYELNDGNIAENHDNPTKYTSDDTGSIQFKTEPTREHYTFNGWYINDTDTPTKTTYAIPASKGDLTFKADWTPIGYTITYNLDGGVNNPANPTTYTVEDEIILKDPTKDGYTFEGWTGTGLSTPTKNVTIPKGTIGNLEFTANWTQLPGGGPGVNGGEVVQPSTEYTITYVLNGGENNSANPATYNKESADITLADPTYDGYTFEGWYTAEALTEKAEAPQIPTGSEGDKTFYAKWAEIKAEEEDEKKQPVVFLPEDKNNNSAQWLALISSSKQIGAYLNGYTDGTFRADAGMTRAEAAAIFARIHKDFSESSFYMPSYTDVSYGDWYAKYVGFIQKKGIADVLTGEYRPNDFITRAEFCTMLANCLAIKYSDNESPFSDASDSRIVALAEKGLINGYDDGTFRPWLGITRAEVAKIVNIAIGRTYDGSHLANPYNDLDSTHWAYGEILKASKK